MQVIGWFINYLRRSIEIYSKDNILYLRIGGIIITTTTIFLSSLIGWNIEQLAFSKYFFLEGIGKILLIISLSSAIATKSLIQSVLAIMKHIQPNNLNKDLDKARNNLSYIVGRNVHNLDEQEILRATAESASENSVDGIFAPIFWMFIGTLFWHFSELFPGPLTFAWIFKSSSTIDSMIGYRKGNLKWLGYSGAKLDDLMTWIPTRLVLITLPLISRPWHLTPMLIKAALREGSQDSSPNSGISESIFANCLKIKMGGENTYGKEKIFKTILAPCAPNASQNSIKSIIKYILFLLIFWTLILLTLDFLINHLLN